VRSPSPCNSQERNRDRAGLGITGAGVRADVVIQRPRLRDVRDTSITAAVVDVEPGERVEIA
jgi:hypothetical protein